MDSAFLIALDKEDGTQRQVMVIQETTGSDKGGIELMNNFKLNEGIEELGTVTFNDDYTEWSYFGELNSVDQKAIAQEIKSRYTQEQLGD
ncbi:hypothetical protein IM792_07390 [Mucilaginibacter sp. JRF]|uniref:hypothetical protein n=1 Tax=Mucilaginibacter sp. JRF TaxID=2780088 RepID=UPI001882DB08|nr:hypothetical protein [Mucilaginibacter sp. JRF]MBE9584265.1 hypothetical protein [Mucilaginibacter sp. JRF]